MQKPRLVKYEEGSIILREGDANTEMYKIISGFAEVYVEYGTPKESLIGILRPQSCFGELGVLLSKPSIYTVVAYCDMLVMRVAESELGGFVAENQKNIIDIMRNMANSVLTMRAQIDLLLKDMEAMGRSQKIDLSLKKQQAKQLLKQYTVFASGKE